MDYLDEINMEISYWWADDMSILEEIYDEEHKNQNMQHAC